MSAVDQVPGQPGRLRRLGSARAPTAAQRRVVQGAMARVRRRRQASAGRRWLPWLPWLLPAVAGAAALVWVIWPGPTVPHGATRVSGATTTAVGPSTGSRPQQPAIWSSLDAPRRVSLGAHRVVLSPRTRLRRESGDPRRPALRLERGDAAFSVAPLSPGDSFRVSTPHLGVVVVGTRFSIEVDELCSRIEVLEGIVRVTAASAGSSERLSAGAARTHCVEPTRPERLTAGESLVRDALEARGREPRRALGLLERYLRRHPDGPLTEEALFHAALLQLQLGQTDRAEALSQRFLRRFGHTHRAGRLRHLLRTESDQARKESHQGR